MRAHVIMTSQKPNAGHVGTYFGISMFRGDSKLTIGTKISIIRGFIAKICEGGGVGNHLPFVR